MKHPVTILTAGLLIGCAVAPPVVSPATEPRALAIAATVPTVTRSIVDTGTRHDTAYDVAEAHCLQLWEDYGWQLHETPEWLDGNGLSCIFEYPPNHEDCSDMGGYDTAPLGVRVCLVEVAYSDLP